MANYEGIVRPEDSRPVGPPGKCTYCQQPIGGRHKEGCVVWDRRVRVRAVVEYEIDVPRTWTKEDIEFHRNDSSWCAGNMVEELESLGDCLCEYVVFEYLGETEAVNPL